MKKVTVFLSFLMTTGLMWAAQPITGIWQSIADDGKTPESIAYFYQYNGKVYGRIIAVYSEGTLRETTANASARADKLVGDPLYVGIDYVYDLGEKGNEWWGLIMDPRTGDEYDCHAWKEGDKLIVRGQLKGIFGGLFGRNQTWKAMSLGMLPKGAQVPDTATLVPKIPVKK